jgi:DNA polymerase
VTELHIDFETRSTVDLKTAGVHAYADHFETDVWCMAFAMGEDDVEVWVPGRGLEREIIRWIEKGGIVVAHNAAFELAIWNRLMVPRYGWPPLDPRQVRCTMAMALAMSLPASLDNAAAAVKLDVRKDTEGQRLMRQMMRPRQRKDDGTLVWWDDEARRNRLAEYCRQDVEVERQLTKRLLSLVPAEQELWSLDMAVNDRGFQVDTHTVNRMILAAEREQARLNRKMARLTGGMVTACSQVAKLECWLSLQGVEVDGVAKADVTALLETTDLPPAVREALVLRRDGSKTSVKKLVAMRDAACTDGRVRGALQFHAASTGRWGGRRVQPQNLPRPILGQEQIEEVIGLFGGAR